jgi:hypothetical protein
MAIDLPSSVPSSLDVPGEIQAQRKPVFPTPAVPFGMRFREPVLFQVAGSSTTTATVSGTWGPDSDTDPNDSDF